MYRSPIEIICADVQKQVDNDIYRVVQKYDIKVDKNELIQALQYDRNQYDKGYADGKADAMAELVRCKDCKHKTVTTDGMVCECALPTKTMQDYYIYGSTILAKVEPDAFCSHGERKDNERKAD